MFEGLKAKLDEMTGENPERLGMLKIMNEGGYRMYAGTVPYATKQKRRSKNKVAKASRKRNRP